MVMKIIEPNVRPLFLLFSAATKENPHQTLMRVYCFLQIGYVVHTKY